MNADRIQSKINFNCCLFLFVLQESFSEHLGYSGGIVTGYVKLQLCMFVQLMWSSVGVDSLYVAHSLLILTNILLSSCLGLICIAHLGSLSSWIVSCPNWGPPSTKCCSSVRWPRSWPSWKTTLRIATSSTCVWTVRQLWAKLTVGLVVTSSVCENRLIL